MNFNKITILILILSLTGCGLPEYSQQILNKHSKESIELPLDHAITLPTPTFDQWDKDYNTFDKYLTKDIMQTQMGLAYVKDSVEIWWCFPSARTHAQLDTATMIKNKTELIGDWRTVCHRRITFEDSAVYSEDKIYRDSKLNMNYDDDIYLALTEEKFRMYAKEKGKPEFKRVANKNYDIESNRYLMLYGVARAGAAVSQIGMDKNGHLIINSHFVEERKVRRKYIVYQATITQMVFKRMTI